MKLKYEDLISGDPIPVNQVGHLCSPQLKELKPTSGIGFDNYNFLLNVMSWDKESFLEFIRKTEQHKFKAFDDERLTIFDVMTVYEKTREILRGALQFFITEKVEWDDTTRSFFTTTKDGQPIGVISRDDFDEVRDMILQLNYINLGKKQTPQRHSSKRSQELWEQVQSKLKEHAKEVKPNKDLQIGNIISKLCASGCGYNLLNVYELTIFQLYDQFFQYGYLKTANLNERAFTIHGGDKFNMQDWLKPIFN